MHSNPLPPQQRIPFHSNAPPTAANATYGFPDILMHTYRSAEVNSIFQFLVKGAKKATTVWSWTHTLWLHCENFKIQPSICQALLPSAWSASQLEASSLSSSSSLTWYYPEGYHLLLCNVQSSSHLICRQETEDSVSACWEIPVF